MPIPVDDILMTIGAMTTPSEREGWEPEAVAEVLASLAEFLDDTVAPTNAVGDAEGCVLAEGRVYVAEPVVEAYRQYRELGWHALGLPREIGGAGAPDVVAAAATEMFAASNHALQVVAGLMPGAVRALRTMGTDDQFERHGKRFASGEALATMCMTEPGAGSDLGAIRTRAERGANGVWRLTGEKIFITGGDHNLTDAVIHTVLARTGSLEDGVKGLSLFVCPADRQDGSRNRVHVLRIEEKMGLHASPTCQLQFDGAEGELVGKEGEGLKAMFVMMNYARLDVALQGVAHASAATVRASEYAETRVQGGGQPIIAHGDVRTMLMEMEALALGSRAMAYRTAAILEEDGDLAEFLTPVCKAFCTDAGSRAADLGIQVLGGYGYLPEYGMEQIWRDCRVTRLYEGTNGIQAMTLVKRLLAGANGAYLGAFEREIAAALAQTPEAMRGDFERLRGDWQTAKSAVLDATDKGLVATAFMRMTGLLFFAGCWGRLAAAEAESARVQRLAGFVQASLLPEGKALAARCERLARF